MALGGETNHKDLEERSIVSYNVCIDFVHSSDVGHILAADKAGISESDENLCYNFRKLAIEHTESLEAVRRKLPVEIKASLESVLDNIQNNLQQSVVDVLLLSRQRPIVEDRLSEMQAHNSILKDAHSSLRHGAAPHVGACEPLRDTHSLLACENVAVICAVHTAPSSPVVGVEHGLCPDISPRKTEEHLEPFATRHSWTYRLQTMLGLLTASYGPVRYRLWTSGESPSFKADGSENGGCGVLVTFTPHWWRCSRKVHLEIRTFRRRRWDQLSVQFGLSLPVVVERDANIMVYTRRGNIAAVRNLLSAGKSTPRDVTAEGITPLHVCSYIPHPSSGFPLISGLHIGCCDEWSHRHMQVTAARRSRCERR